MSVSWKGAYGAITNEAARRGIFELPPRYTSGQALGIIAVDLDYPKVPGNVVNATTYDFPVLYEMVSFEIEQLFAGDPNIKEQVIAAAKKLEAEGVRAIIGACGYFAHFQKDVAAAVGVPVFMSSLCQLATIKTWLPSDRKIAVFAADGVGEGGSDSADVTGTYAEGTSSIPVYSVDIAWEGLSFTYNGGNEGTWNPDTHQYDGSTEPGWADDEGVITITNHSNVAVTALSTY